MNMQLLSYFGGLFAFVWVLFTHYSTFLPNRKQNLNKNWEKIYGIKEN